MIKHTVETCIREFDFNAYNMNINARLDTHEWPSELAEIITKAVREELDTAMKIVLDARFQGVPG